MPKIRVHCEEGYFTLVIIIITFITLKCLAFSNAEVFRLGIILTKARP